MDSFGRQSSAHFVHLLSAQLVLLLFADDVALTAHSAEGLWSVFQAFSAFCAQEGLTISE